MYVWQWPILVGPVFRVSNVLDGPYTQQPIDGSSMLGPVNALSTSVSSSSLRSSSVLTPFFSNREYLSGEHHVSFEWRKEKTS